MTNMASSAPVAAPADQFQFAGNHNSAKLTAAPIVASMAATLIH